MFGLVLLPTITVRCLCLLHRNKVLLPCVLDKNNGHWPSSWDPSVVSGFSPCDMYNKSNNKVKKANIEFLKYTIKNNKFIKL